MSLFNFTGSGVPLDALLLDIAEKLKDARAKMGWSQKTLADAAGIDRAYVGSVERGKQNFTFGGLKKITDALTKSIFDLIGQGAKSLSACKHHELKPIGQGHDANSTAIAKVLDSDSLGPPAFSE